ncbi:hypothetical protein B0H14DRAFT_3854238 [Mycena olivaceomarginata]|nr:hypothetical protein B0H14DRAFT_3854238 [Mycena olivaceomarginata]
MDPPQLANQTAEDKCWALIGTQDWPTASTFEYYDSEVVFYDSQVPNPEPENENLASLDVKTGEKTVDFHEHSQTDAGETSGPTPESGKPQGPETHVLQWPSAGTDQSRKARRGNHKPEKIATLRS